MSKYSIGIYEKAFPDYLPFAEMLRVSAENGFDFFEISVDRSEKRIHRLSDMDFINAILNTDRTKCIPIRSICLSALSTYTLGHSNRSIECRALEIAIAAIHFADKLGIRLIQIPACDVPKGEISSKETDERFLNNLRSVIDYASAYGIIISLENMENAYMNTITKCMRVIEHIHSPFFQLYPDVGNLTTAGINEAIDYQDEFNRGYGHYVGTHLKETNPTRYGGLFYGEGHVDFYNMTRLAWLFGVRRYVMEFWYTGNPKWENDLSEARKLCEQWIETAIKNTQG